MHNWNPGVKTTKKAVHDLTHKHSTLVRLLLAVAISAGVKTEDIVRNMRRSNTLGFAQDLSDKLGEERRKDLEKAVHDLTK